MTTATIICPACGDAQVAPDGKADFLARNITRCDLCDAHIVYGELAPPIFVEPATFDTVDGPKPAFRIRIQDPKTREDRHVLDLDPRHAFLIAQSIISLVRP